MVQQINRETSGHSRPIGDGAPLDAAHWAQADLAFGGLGRLVAQPQLLRTHGLARDLDREESLAGDGGESSAAAGVGTARTAGRVAWSTTLS